MAAALSKSEHALNAHERFNITQSCLFSIFITQHSFRVRSRLYKHPPSRTPPNRGSLYCVIKCIVRGHQARVKNADLRHPSRTVVMYKCKSASPVPNVLRLILIVFSHLHLRLPGSSILQASLLKLIVHTCYMPNPSHLPYPFDARITCPVAAARRPEFK
jgi:hypothetical protein